MSSRGPSGDGGFSLRSLEELNEVFSDFEIRRLLGRGGMGAVYEAWQKSLTRPVALKLLPPELLRSQDFFDRFQREARLMAQMDHPNVARVYDSGITDDGEAYIVMELVAGVPITTDAASRGLDLRNRLSLFHQVCCGVQHAHQKGIIHRDLKPSNILVAEIEGRKVPKVIDFGLAKPLEQSAGDEAVWLSAGHAVGTPAYMSPEQAAGRDIDSRSDIYSLGALLYELLTGRTFLDEAPLRDATRTKIEATIRQTPVPRPSAGKGTINCPDAPSVTPSAFRGDLDAIVLKALEKDPARRYETVAALADDIQRYLTHQPVLAVHPHPLYLTGKFCRRHRVGLAIAAGFVIVLIAGVVLIVHESFQARQAEHLAGERLRQGERLIEFLLGDLHAKLETVGRIDVLEATVGEVEQFYAQHEASDLSPESLRNRGRAMLRLGQIRNAQAKADAAKSHYEEAIRIYNTAIGLRPTQLAWKEELGRTWNSLAVFHHLRGEWAAAESAYRAAITLADGLLKAAPDRSDWVEFKASLLHNFASLCEANKRLDEAEEKYSEALRLWKPLLARAPDDLKLLENVSHLYLNLAFLQGRRGLLDRVNASNAEALRLRERLVQLDPVNIRFRVLLADSQQNISEVHLNQGNLEEAEVWINRYRPVREQLAARDPQNVEWQHSLADAWRNFAVLQSRRDNLETAAEAHRKAWEIYEARLGSSSSSGVARLRWAEGLEAADETFARLAQREQGKGNLSAAQQYGKTVVEIRAKLAGEKPNELPPRHRLGLALLDLATTSLAKRERASAQQQAYLALLLLAKSLEAGVPPHLEEGRWKLVCELSGGILQARAATEEQNRDSFRAALMRLAEDTSIDAALGGLSIQWPPNLAAELRKWAARP